MEVSSAGAPTSGPKICLLLAKPGVSAQAERAVLWGWELQFIEDKLRRAGIPRDWVTFDVLSDGGPDALRERLNAIPTLTVLMPTDEQTLTFTTGLKSLSKWQLSLLDSERNFRAKKTIPTYGPTHVRKEFSHALYVELALKRAREECETEAYARKPKHFLLNPNLEETHAYLEKLTRLGPTDWLSVDIETGRGQINTVGFAWSESDAIAIQALPSRCSAEEYYRLWTHIGAVLRGPSRKIFQNGIYEVLYFARYGIRVANFSHDTMNVQKFLWPEFEKGLDNVGRFYTREPYWKDSGRVESEEGRRKDWGAIRDWPMHFAYNARDTTGTYEAALAQRRDLEARGELSFYDDYLLPLTRISQEMCLRGLPVCRERQLALVTEYEGKVAALVAGLTSVPVRGKKQISSVTRTQKQALLEAKGYVIPKVKDKKTGKLRKSVDELSLKKLLAKHPEDTDIPKLLKIAEYEKALSSYFRVETDPLDGNVRFMLDTVGTETGRWSSSLDPWGRGCNMQTLPKYAKKMVRWSSGRIFVQIDLKQAESRFVAYDAADLDLIQCLEDPKRDIHSEVAAEIFGCSVEQVRAEKAAGDDSKRQLGKKSGHGANYGMAANTFVDSCLKELDLVITKDFATKVLEAYHRLFSGIRRWHAQLRDEIYRSRRLQTPLGRVRYFYGRADDQTFREAYAFRPQATVPDLVRHLLLHLVDERKAGNLDFWPHLECHDSLTLSCATQTDVDRIAQFATDLNRWHPQVRLSAGLLRIPVSIETGPGLGELSAWGES